MIRCAGSLTAEGGESLIGEWMVLAESVEVDWPLDDLAEQTVRSSPAFGGEGSGQVGVASASRSLVVPGSDRGLRLRRKGPWRPGYAAPARTPRNTCRARAPAGLRRP